jgi:8-oxo-dGTP pyrophosphatase MutT (NUDIX family)
MYISAESIRELEQKYGIPAEVSLCYEMTEREFEQVRRSQKRGRAHDVTLFIVRDSRIAVIKKPMYPPGAYRAPSGGVAPGESFEDGAVREALEETGLAITLQTYVMRIRVKFTNDVRVIDWTSHVFLAVAPTGDLDPIDTVEIAEARWASVEQLTGPIRDALLASGSTGLRYRSDLNDMVISRLPRLDLSPGD